jgi:hypothetical protein
MPSPSNASEHCTDCQNYFDSAAVQPLLQNPVETTSSASPMNNSRRSRPASLLMSFGSYNVSYISNTTLDSRTIQTAVKAAASLSTAAKDNKVSINPPGHTRREWSNLQQIKKQNPFGNTSQKHGHSTCFTNSAKCAYAFPPEPHPLDFTPVQA